MVQLNAHDNACLPKKLARKGGTNVAYSKKPGGEHGAVSQLRFLSMDARVPIALIRDVWSESSRFRTSC
jgi:hypothetical protein